MRHSRLGKEAQMFHPPGRQVAIESQREGNAIPTLEHRDPIPGGTHAPRVAVSGEPEGITLLT
jgi:hypothetical protein